MSREVRWTTLILNEFIAQGCITEENERILRLHVAGWSRVKIADACCCSVSTVDRAIKRLKEQYDEVQKYDPILPPRKQYHDMIRK